MSQVGTVRYSDWLKIDQAKIDAFAAVTGDHQFIHVDPERAAVTAFGGTIAHGFLTLSLLPLLRETARFPPIAGLKLGVNYGFDRVRLVTPVRPGYRIRAVFTVETVEEKGPAQIQQTLSCTVEIEGSAKPALVALWIIQLFF